jgi:hypothetical protein
MDGQHWYASFMSLVMDKKFNGHRGTCNNALRGGPDESVSTLWGQFMSANDMTN